MKELFAFAYVWLYDTVFELVAAFTIGIAMVLLLTVIVGPVFWAGYRVYDFFSKGN